MKPTRATAVTLVFVTLFVFARCNLNLPDAYAAGPGVVNPLQSATGGNGGGEDEWAEAQPGPRVADPLEGFNRAMYHFNDFFYFHALKPVAQGYKFVVPERARICVKNFFYNIEFPTRFVNNIFQAKFEAAGAETFRFLTNSTVGVLGLFNPASNFPELTPPPEDTGQTFGVWGIGNGFYLVWPILGPSTLRDTFGLGGDYMLDPVSYVEPLSASFEIWGYDIVNETSLTIGEYEAIKESSLDPYTAIKDAYMQYRDRQIAR